MCYQTQMPLIFSILSSDIDHRTHTITGRIPKSPTDKQFLFLFDSCLYVVHLSLGPFFPEVTKKIGNIG